MLATVLAGCEKGAKLRATYPYPSAGTLAKGIKSMKPEAGWEASFEKVIDGFDMGADRYEWHTPVRGSYRTIEVKHPSGKTVIQANDYAHWFGCGWAYYSNPPKGVDSKVARIAAMFYRGQPARAVLYNTRAQEACRFAPPVPTNASATELEIVQNPPTPSFIPKERIENEYRRGQRLEKIMYGGLLIEIREPNPQYEVDRQHQEIRREHREIMRQLNLRNSGK
ncbi:MAG: hypothetical protein KUG59_04005 [Parvibaculaceae bacterium]|nr:hypothetical protein [Parvibaculaceae bacterium]